MITFVTVIHISVCLFLSLVVLLQAGKGGGMGIAFGGGGGAGQAVFGGRGAGSFLEKLTAGTAIVFMLTSGYLAYRASQTESHQLEGRSAELKKQKEEKKKHEAEENKKAEDAAKKELEQKAKGGAATP